MTLILPSSLKVTLMTTKDVEALHAEKVYLAYFETVRRAVDTELQALMPRIGKLGMNEKLAYVLQTKGKRLRSDLAMLSGQSVGGTMHSLQRLCLAIELLHAATLVHDDILDKDTFRRDALSVQAKWGVKDAILVGDALASLSLSLASEYGREIVTVMADTCLMLSDGEYMDVETTCDELSEESYTEKIRKKSASLFKAAAQCGAIAGGGLPSEVGCLMSFGENYGVAYQIKDDASDVASLGRGDLPSDLREFRATLPIIHLYENSDDKVKALIQNVASAHRRSGSRERLLLTELEVALENTHSLSYCDQKISLFLDRAATSIAPLRDSVYKTYLAQMAESLKPR